MKTFFRSMFVTCLILATGCGLDGPIQSGPRGDAPATNAAAEPNSETEHAAGDKKTSEGAADNSTGAGKAETKRPRGRRLDTGSGKAAVEAAPGTVREAAHVGMGEKGRGYGGNMITEPVHVMWNARELIILQQIEKAMNFYKGSEGHAPRTQEEFDNKIIKENSIRLPSLPDGHHYVYDPNKEELLIERPNNNP